MKIKTVQIDADVEAVLRQAKLDAFGLTLQGQLDRAMYVKVNKILELIGFKWDRKAGCHAGQGDACGKLMQALNAGSCVDEKKTFQFFETPERLAGRMASLAEISPGDRVLEPSAGKGSIIRAIQQECPHLAVVFACELNPEMAKLLKARDAEQALSLPDRQVVVEECDFLQHKEKYDRIVMNPPFTQGNDVEHVRHAYDLLLPGGRLVAITSKAWQSHDDKKSRAFRDWHCGLVEDGLASFPEELPEGTFKESGTGIATLLLILLKPRSAAKVA